VFCLARPTRKHKERASGHWTWTPGLISCIMHRAGSSRIDRQIRGGTYFAFFPHGPRLTTAKLAFQFRTTEIIDFWRPGAPETTPKGGARPRLFWFLGPPGPSRTQKSMANPGPDFFCVAFPTVRGRLRQTLFGGPSASGLLAMRCSHFWWVFGRLWAKLDPKLPP
jgi:hypothetical protein